MLNIHGSGPAVTKEEILAIANGLSIAIPDEVVDFYIKNNGGHCKKNTLFVGEEGYKINEFLSFSSGEESIEKTYKDVFFGNEEMPQNLVPFAVDAGGDYFCFDVSENGFGRVFFFESEYYDDPERAVVYLSENFSDFIEKLEAEK